MKKQHLFFTAFISLTMLVNAQTTIPNGGFETWTNVSSATAQPTNWNSNKTGGGFASSGPQTCYQDTSTLGGGQYCVKIVTGSTFGTIVNGSCTTGEVQAPSVTKADGYIETIAGDAAHSAPFTGRPDSLVFWFRYTPGSGGDTPSVQARLHVGNAYAPEAPSNSNHPDSTVNIIARAIWTATGATVASWTRVSVPFVYVAGAPGSRTPQYILVTMTSSADNVGGVANSTLWVDEIQAIYNPNGINEVSASDISIYPNPASKVLNIQASEIISAVSVQDETGRVVADAGNVNSLHYQLNTSHLSSGIYFVNVYSGQGSAPTVRKVVIE